MSDIQLSQKEAYLAMYFFLEHLYELTNDDSLGGFLGSMRLLDDDMPADSAYWSDWLDAVQKAIQQRQ
jgi:hypothetical protein